MHFLHASIKLFVQATLHLLNVEHHSLLLHGLAESAIARQRVLCKRCRGYPMLCIFYSRCVSAPAKKRFHIGHCTAASVATYLCKGAGIKVPLPCIVSQRPHFSQYRSRKLTPLKELDSIWPSQLIVMVYMSKFCMYCPCWLRQEATTTA